MPPKYNRIAISTNYFLSKNTPKQDIIWHTGLFGGKVRTVELSQSEAALSGECNSVSVKFDIEGNICFQRLEHFDYCVNPCVIGTMFKF
jgi:hypothetical protein